MYQVITEYFQRVSLPVVALIALSLAPLESSAQLAIGALSHDGPATPEQLSLIVPVTGSLPTTATATVRYKTTGSSTWITGHPLFRIRPGFSSSPAVGSVVDAFAWPIIDLTPGTSYDVEVTVTSGNQTQVLNQTFTTRGLPAPAGAANKTVSAGATSSEIQAAVNGLQPGDVLQIQNGTYTVDDLTIGVSGTANNPIIIRGESRDGTVLSQPSGEIIEWGTVSNVIVENLTLRGSGVDGGTNQFNWGMRARDTSTVSRVTVRNVTITGVNQGIVFANEASEILIYDTTLIGNNQWTSQFIQSNLTWNDDGIRTPGYGNAVFNNTLRGFGDTLSVAGHLGNNTLTEAMGVHFYRNDVRNSGDDLFEADHGHRNISFYDNRSHNSMTFLSLDPLYGGPLLFARNVAVNVGRTVHKWNSTNSGQFVYNNTMLISERAAAISGWYQPNNGPQRAYGYRNNILIYRGAGNTLWLDSTGHDPIDFTHNCWYPDRQVQWGGVWPSLANAQAAVGPTTPVFSGQSQRLFEDRICERDPFVVDINMGADFLTEVTESYTPSLSNGTAPKNSGVTIPNITDGFSGGAPDRGAVISGRPTVPWGDRIAGPSTIPNSPTNLSAGD